MLPNEPKTFFPISRLYIPTVIKYNMIYLQVCTQDKYVQWSKLQELWIPTDQSGEVD